MHSLRTTGCTAVVVSTLVFGGGAAAAGAFPTVLSDNPTNQPDSLFLGPPDDFYSGLGAQSLTFDFGVELVVNRPGMVDLNVYEYDTSNVEFQLMGIFVSLDGVQFFDIKASERAVVDITGDGSHGASRFARSYDLGSLGTARYVRIVGLGNGNAGGSNGFDLDAIGAHEVLPVIPEPATAALLLAGLLATAVRLRRAART